MGAKTKQPAPLFWVALAYGCGCGGAFISSWSSAIWFLGIGLGVILWAGSWLGTWKMLWEKRETITSLFFLIVVGMVGGFWAALRMETLPLNEVRCLGPEKEASTTEWKGRVGSFPEHRELAQHNGSHRFKFVFNLHAWKPAGKAMWEKASGKVHVVLFSPEKLAYGEELVLSGGLQKVRGPLYPGQFDYRAYLAQRDIYFALYPTDYSREGLGWMQRFGAMAMAWHAQQWVLHHLRLGMEKDPTAEGLLAGMLLGATQKIPMDLAQAFRNTGTYHIFAVSGQNVGVIALVGLTVLRLLGKQRWRWAWTLAPLLVLYCLITGNQSSAVRALAMALAVILAWQLERPLSVLNFWSIAVLGVLTYDPKFVGDLGFQLSFAVVWALIVLSPRIFRWLYRPFAVDPWIPWMLVTSRQRWGCFLISYPLGLFSASLAAWIGSFPFILFYFHQISLVGLLANLVVVPLASVVVVLGVFAITASLVSSSLVIFFNQWNGWALHCLIFFVVGFNEWPGAYFYVPDRRVDWQPQAPEFICLSTSAHPSALIRYQHQAWLINPGNEKSWRYVMNPLRQYYGRNRFEGVLLTERCVPTGGGSRLVRQEHLTTLWMVPPSQGTRSFEKEWKKLPLGKQEGLQELSAGDVVELAQDFRMQVLSPSFPLKGAKNRADDGLVLLFEHLGRRLLWASRISSEREEQLQKTYPKLKVDVVVQGKHPQKPNQSQAWLFHLSPQHVIVSPSLYSSFFPPSVEKKGEKKQASLSPQVWNTQKQGAVAVILDPQGMRVQRVDPSSSHAMGSSKEKRVP